MFAWREFVELLSDALSESGREGGEMGILGCEGSESGDGSVLDSTSFLPRDDEGSEDVLELEEEGRRKARSASRFAIFFRPIAAGI